MKIEKRVEEKCKKNENEKEIDKGNRRGSEPPKRRLYIRKANVNIKLR